MKRKITIPFEVLLLIIAIVAFYQLAFLLNSVKWDMIVGYLPRRYFIGECLQNGIYPLWNPYGECGYPIYGNLISTWSPLIMFTGLLTGYTNLTLHFFFIVHVYMAGLGMFQLIKYFKNSRIVAFTIGVAYMLSGIFIGNAQHINIISGASWLPWIVFFYLKLSDKHSFKNIIWTVIFIFLMVTDGYPAITIIAVYMLLGLFILMLSNKLNKKKYRSALQWFWGNGAIAIILVVMLIGQIMAFQEVAPHINRFEGVDFNRAFSMPFSFKSFISFLFPYATAANPEIFGTDISMANGYFGIIMLVIFATTYYIFKVKKIGWFFLFFGILALLASLGDETPVREFTYKYIPMMDKFRYPSLFRVFSIFGFLIFAGFGLQKATLNDNTKLLVRFIGSFTLGITILFLGLGLKELFISDVKLFGELSNSTWSSRVVSQGIIQIALLSVLVLFAQLKHKNLLKIISVLVVVDMVIAVQFNIHATAVSKKDPVKYYTQIVTHPKGFPIPSRKPIIEQTDNLFRFGPSWKNGSIFRKEVTHQGYNPFLLNTYVQLDTTIILRDNVLQNPLVFYSDSIVKKSDFHKFNLQPNIVVLDDSLFQKYSDKEFETDTNDLWEITHFTPTNITVNTSTKYNQILSLLQTNYPGWKVQIDEKEVDHFTSNIQFISIVLPAGKHEVTFTFVNKKIKSASTVSLSLFVILLLIGLTLLTSRKNKKIRSTGLAIIGLLVIIIVVKHFLPKYTEVQQVNYKQIAKILNKNKTITNNKLYFNIDNPLLLKSMIKNRSINIESPKIYRTKDLARLIKKADSSVHEESYYIWSNTYSIPELKGYLYLNYQNIEVLFDKNKSQVCQMKQTTADKLNKEMVFDYEPEGLLYSSFEKHIDTTDSYSGKQCITMNPENKFGSNIVLNKGQHFSNKDQFVAIESYIKTSTESDAFLVVKFFNGKNGKPTYSKSIQVNSYILNPNGWNRCIIANKIPDGTSKIQIFYHNPSGTKTISIDQTKIRIIKNDVLNCGYAGD